jgi:hypothetical protein
MLKIFLWIQIFFITNIRNWKKIGEINCIPLAILRSQSLHIYFHKTIDEILIGDVEKIVVAPIFTSFRINSAVCQGLLETLKLYLGSDNKLAFSKNIQRFNKSYFNDSNRISLWKEQFGSTNKFIFKKKYLILLVQYSISAMPILLEDNEVGVKLTYINDLFGIPYRGSFCILDKVGINQLITFLDIYLVKQQKE